MTRSRSIFRLKLVVGGWLVVCCLLVAVWRLPNYNHDRFFNADVASAYNLAFDLVSNPIAMLDWWLPSANYIFPEQFLLVPLALTGLKMDLIAPIYSAAVLLVIALGSYLLSMQVLTPRCAAACSITSFASISSPAILAVYPMFALVVPNFHGGVFILIPVILTLAIRAIDSDSTQSRYSTLGVGVLLLLLGFSDRLTAVAVAVPLVLALAGVFGLSASSRLLAFRIAITAAAATFLGILLDVLWRPDNPGARVSFAAGQFAENSVEMWRLGSDLRLTMPWVWWLVPMTPLLALLTLRYVAVAANAETLSVMRARWLLLAGFAAAYSPVMQVVHAASSLEPVLHYRMGDVVVAAVFAPIALSRVLQKKIVNLWSSFLLALSAATLLHALYLSNKRSYGLEEIAPFVACMDRLAEEHGIKYGAGEYWDAVPIRPLSKNGVVAISVAPNLSPRPWNQTNHFDDSRNFEFLILHPSLDAQLVSGFRDGAILEKCGEKRVLVKVSNGSSP